jgi:hypothetical protein
MSWLDTNNYTPTETPGRTLMEAGRFPFQLVDYEILTTRDGNGKRVKAVMECCDARYAGVKLFHNWNIKNKSEKAVEISKREIFDVARAVGVDLVIEDPVLDLPRELNKCMDHVIACDVEIEKGKGTYTDKNGEEVERKDQNRIVGFAKWVDGPAATEAPAERGRLAR